MELQRTKIISDSCPAPPPFQELRPHFVAANGLAECSGSPADKAGQGPDSAQTVGAALRSVAEACEVRAQPINSCKLCCHSLHASAWFWGKHDNSNTCTELVVGDSRFHIAILKAAWSDLICL